MEGTAYTTEGYGFLCMPRNIYDSHHIFGEADAWLDLWCHTIFGDKGNAFSCLCPVIQYGKYGAVLTLEKLGQRWGWEKTKVWRFFKKHSDVFTLQRLPSSFGCLVFNFLYPAGVDVQVPSQDQVVSIMAEILISGNYKYKENSENSTSLRIDRSHRLAETAAFFRLVGIETRPYELPTLQMMSFQNIVPAEPVFYTSHALKHFGQDSVNKIAFSRITGMLFSPGGCYVIYNSRDSLMNWNGRGEGKVRLHLSSVARMNAGVDEVNSAMMLGLDYHIAKQTLAFLGKVNRVEMRFDNIYSHLHFIPLNPKEVIMKTKIWKCVALMLALMCILTFPIGASAAAQGTNGDEMQVATPEKLEIHLGQQWAGVTFELTTDYGKYPDPIPVGEDGVLRLEIGGSSSYVLSCLSSAEETPAPDETVPEDTTPSEEATTGTEDLVDIETIEPVEEENTVSGIPVTNIVLFGGGLVLAVGALVGINLVQKRRAQSSNNADDEK